MPVFHDLRVSGIVQETADSRSFLFEVPASLRREFAYRAGQFLTFELPFDGMRIRRCYSLASAPETDAWHKVTVKRVPRGRASNWMHDRLSVGSTLAVQAPEGRFVLRDGDDRPLTLFAGGSGITPVIALLKTALVTTGRSVRLIYANRDAASIIFRDELALLCRAFGERLSVHHHLDDARGFLTRETLRPLLAGSEESTFYTCGPTPFMDAVEATLEALHVEHERRHFERFVSPLDPDRRPEATPVLAGEAPESFTVVLDGKTHLVPYTPGETLLAAAKRAGIEPPSSCEEGYCGCCLAKMMTGKVHMTTHEAITDDDLKKGWVLACQACAASAEPIAIDFDQPY